MGGYSFNVALAKTKKKANEAAVVAAGRELWDWFYVETRDRSKTPLGKLVHAYVEMYTPPTSIRLVKAALVMAKPVASSALSLGVGDAGGTAYHTMLATIHMLTLLTDSEPEIVQIVLDRHGLAPAEKQPRDEYIREQRFFVFESCVAQIFEGSVTRDSNGEDDGHQIEIAKLPAASRKKVLAFSKSKRCECPVCGSKKK